MDLDLEKFYECYNFIRKVNNNPLGDIKIDGKSIPNEDIEEFRLTGLANKDYFLMLSGEIDWELRNLHFKKDS